MEITQTKSGDTLTIRLNGRLDASWSAVVQKALDEAVRAGEHRITLDLGQVGYISSAGLGVILYLYKQLREIKGHFCIGEASPFVHSALNMAGLGSLLGTAQPEAEPKSDTGEAASSARATYEVFSLFDDGFELKNVGDASALDRGAADSEPFQFHPNSFALGVGALGTSHEDCRTRFGEFLSVAGIAAFQPADGSRRPDFMLSQEDFIPEGNLLYGLAGEGGFGLLARFEAKKEFSTVGLSELAATALSLAKASTVAIVAITETAGLVGASLRQSPAPAATPGARFHFPEIRDWLAFSSERCYRDSTSLIVGVVSKDANSVHGSMLRPLSPSSGLFGHFHAAAFPYRPLQKGRIELPASVAALFDAQTVNAVVHLLSDPREFNGAGESEFLRGALWIASVAEPQKAPATS